MEEGGRKKRNKIWIKSEKDPQEPILFSREIIFPKNPEIHSVPIERARRTILEQISKYQDQTIQRRSLNTGYCAYCVGQNSVSQPLYPNIIFRRPLFPFPLPRSIVRLVSVSGLTVQSSPLRLPTYTLWLWNEANEVEGREYSRKYREKGNDEGSRVGGRPLCSGKGRHAGGKESHGIFKLGETGIRLW